MEKRRKTQSILEYIIVLSAIVLVVIAASGPGGLIRTAVNKMFSDSSKLIEEQSTDFLSRAAGGRSTPAKVD